MPGQLLGRQVPVPVRTIAILPVFPALAIVGEGGGTKTGTRLHHPKTHTHTRSRQARVSGGPIPPGGAIGTTTAGGVTIEVRGGTPIITRAIRGLSTTRVNHQCRNMAFASRGLDKLFTLDFPKNRRTYTFVQALGHGGQHPGTRGREQVQEQVTLQHLRFSMMPWA